MTIQGYKIEGDSITLTKKELEEIRDHFCKVADEFKPKKDDEKFDFRYPYYLGRADSVVYILKLFDKLDSAL